MRFAYRVAGPARRSLAYLIDLLLRGAILVALGLLLALGGLTDLENIDGWSLGLWSLIAFAIEWTYYVLFETLDQGRSPGKRALGLRVVKDGGYPINIMDSLLRNLLRAADFLPSFYALGVVVMGLDSRFRRLGDLVAGTMVAVDEPAYLADAISLHPAPTEQELAAIPGTVRLRGREREDLALFIRRLPGLSRDRADELAALVQPLFADRLPAAAAEAPARWLGILYLRATQAGSRSP